MNKKYFIIVLGLLFSLNLNSSVRAVQDAVGDATVSGYDILKATALVYPPSSIQPGVKAADFIKVGLAMNSGSHLPGIVLMEFDVDNNPLTGGSSLCGMYDACEGGFQLKVQSGIDIAILLMLRDQGDNVPSAWCYDCYGGATCATRGAACSACDKTYCYTPASMCSLGEPNCYVLGEHCVCNEPDYCRVLDTPCSYDTPCSTGRTIGEWYAIAPAAGPEVMVERGKLEPLPAGTNSDDEDCYTLPWAIIVQSAYSALSGNPEQFDLFKATDSANLKFQVSTWYDPDFYTTENDFINTTQVCAEITDVVPNSGMASASQGKEICEGNFDGDRDVDGLDLMKFKEDWGRSGFINPCPSCW